MSPIEETPPSDKITDTPQPRPTQSCNSAYILDGPHSPEGENLHISSTGEWPNKPLVAIHQDKEPHVYSVKILMYLPETTTKVVVDERYYPCLDEIQVVPIQYGFLVARVIHIHVTTSDTLP